MNSAHIGTGPTAELSLRVSVATLSRVIFPRPGDGIPMLTLENKATLIPDQSGSQVTVAAQPFGGAIRILDIDRFLRQVGRFHFDSERSRSEQDFRIFIQPSAWEALRTYCLHQLSMADGDLDVDPCRELVEEFQDTLGIRLRPDQYGIKPVGLVLENEPAPTDNLRAAGNRTVRIYSIDEVQISDPDLSERMAAAHEAQPVHRLRNRTLEDVKKGGRGRANAMVAAPLGEIVGAYLNIPPEKRGEIVRFKGMHLAGNVAAVLDGVSVPKYRRCRFAKPE